MAIESTTIVTLYDDAAKTKAFAPRTKVSAISNDNGTDLQTLLDGKLNLTGGTLTGALKFQSSSLPSKTLSYICGIDAFANGGEMGWQSKSDFLSGYATTAQLGNYLPLSGGTLTGRLSVNDQVFGYSYSKANNIPAFIFDKPGSNYTGIGANGSDSTIHFGPVSYNSTNARYEWATTPAQTFDFLGNITTSAGITAGYDIVTAHTNNPYIVSQNTNGEDCSFVLKRDPNANWRILNSDGHLYFQSDWYGAKGSYHNEIDINCEYAGTTFYHNVRTQHSSGGESSVGANFKGGNLYLYGNTSSGTRGIYDSVKGHVIQVTDSSVSLSGNATTSSAVKDSTNGTTTYINYGAAGLSTTSWFAAWNGYELRAISPAVTKKTIGAATAFVQSSQPTANAKGDIWFVT